MNRDSLEQPKDALIEEALVLEFQAGNGAAFDRLVEKHRDRIFNLCYWLIGDYQEADEATQDTFLKAYGGLSKFNRQAAFSTWLHRIAVNTCKNRLKSLAYRLRKMTRSFANGTQPGHEAPLMALQDQAPSPLEALERREDAAVLAHALDRLPKDKRMVLVLREIEGLSYEEIAKTTGLALGTVKSKLARARTALAVRLKRDGIRQGT